MGQLNAYNYPLVAPGQLFQAVQTGNRTNVQPLPTPVVRPPQTQTLNKVSLILQGNDQLQLSTARSPLPQAVLPAFSLEAYLNPPSATLNPKMAPQALAQRLSQAAQAGLKEWQSGVRETSTNSSPRIDQYARNAKFGRGYEWCGFFTAFAHSQTGFKYPQSWASYQKARDFFMYRSYTNRSAATNQALDQLRLKHQSQGNTRQYFMLSESPNAKYVKDYSRYFSHYDAKGNTFNFQNLPIHPGDVALFHHGHVGMVVSYDAKSGKLVTVEGNTAGTGPNGKYWTQAVVKKEYDLSKASVRAKFDGFGRAALDDYA